MTAVDRGRHPAGRTCAPSVAAIAALLTLLAAAIRRSAR